MTRILLAGVAAAALVAPAFAADVPPSMPPPRAPVYVPFFTWSGLYAGINAGYGWGNSDWTVTGTGVGTGTFNVNGGMIGGTLGYNYQAGSFVFGVEADLDWSGIKGSSTSIVCIGFCETKNTWLGTARGRIGYAFDRYLPYVTGGVAFGGLKISSGSGATASSTPTGWTLGAGFEYAFMGSWSAKLEYLYVDLGKATCDAACSGGLPFDVGFKTNVIRGGVNYKF
jgi:outer membrane immunogenic protein